jgi:hypothetical protein
VIAEKSESFGVSKERKWHQKKDSIITVTDIDRSASKTKKAIKEVILSPQTS